MKLGKDNSMQIDMEKMMEIATKYLGKEEVAKMMTGDFSKFEALGKKFFNGEGSTLLKNILDHIPEGEYGRKLNAEQKKATVTENDHSNNGENSI